MTEAARHLFRYLAKTYRRIGYPPPQAWGFSPAQDWQRHGFSELEALGLIEQLAGAWSLTEKAVALIGVPAVAAAA